MHEKQIRSYDQTSSAVQAWGTPLYEDLAYSKGVPAALIGGFNSDYTANNNRFTDVYGTLTIVSGGLVIENISIH